MSNEKNEFDEAIALADRVLDRPYADPDDDLAVLARQLKRATERADAYRATLRRIADVNARGYGYEETCDCIDIASEALKT